MLPECLDRKATDSNFSTGIYKTVAADSDIAINYFNEEMSALICFFGPYLPFHKFKSNSLTF